MKLIIAIALCVLTLGVPLTPHAETYPDRPIRIIVANGAGGGTDAFARIIGQKLGEAWDQAVIVENRPGAQGTIGTAFGAKAEPDGYTLTLAFTSTFAINPFIYPNIGYDPLKDFTAVALGVKQSYLMVTGPSAPFDSLLDLAARAKAEPMSHTFASTSSQTELIGVLFQMLSETRMLYVPYKSASPAVIDLARGDIDLMYASLPSTIPFVQAGKLKALAVTGSRRVAALPDVKTAGEAGFPDLDVMGWYGFVVPTGTPVSIINKLNAEINRILEMPDVLKSLEVSGFEASGGTVEEFASLMRLEYERWGKIVEASKKMTQ